MKNFIAKIILVIATLGLFASATLAPTASALDITDKGRSDSDTLKNTGGESFAVTVGKVISTLLFLLGIVAVIAIIVGGFRFVTANGDPNAVKAARNIILYAAVGLIVAILAFTIVNFVLGAFQTQAS